MTSNVVRWLRRVLCILCVSNLASATGPCAHGEFGWQAEEETWSRLRHLRGIIRDFAGRNARLPGILSEICEPEGPCPYMFATEVRRGFRDGWGHPIEYRLTDGEYELRSLGKDGRPETADDILIKPSVEREAVKHVAGCYWVDLGWWKALNTSVLALDTLSPDPGVYLLGTEVEGYYGGTWEVRGLQEVVLEWREQHSSATLRFRVIGDSLRGIAMIPEYPDRDVKGVRVSCLAAPPPRG